MIRLLYISTGRAVLEDKELEALLRKSRTRNAMVGVTGLLVVGGRRFLQVLEGTENAVLQTYDRICHDKRHFAPVVLSRQPIDTRLFPNWSMGYQKGGEDVAGSTANDLMQSLIAPISDPNTKAYFEQFVIKHMAA